MSALIGRSLEVVICTRGKEVGVEQEKYIIEQHGTGIGCGLVEGPQELVPRVRIEQFDLERVGRVLIRRLAGRGPLQVLMHDGMDLFMHDYAAVEVALRQLGVRRVFDQ